MAAYTTIDNPEAYFQVKAYTGSEGTDTISLDSDVMQPDMVWIKDRGTTAAHTIQDAVRGWNAANKISSNHTSGEDDSEGATWGNYGYVSAVASSSFTVVEGANTPSQVNDGGGDTYIAWCWKESATAGFDIVGFTGTGSAKTESHSLSAVPKMIIAKNRVDTSNWSVYHVDNGNTHNLRLNDTSAKEDDSSIWNDTTPTSSVFTVGTDNNVNGSSNAIIAYLFAEKQGFSKFGSYTGNSNADGTFVHTGFRPAFIMVKATNTTENWNIFDNKRSNSFNAIDGRIIPNSSAAEETNVTPCDFVSNGVKFRYSDGAWNNSSNTYIYMAFAEAPFVNSNGVPCNAR